ncbi:uncharacterized protein PADG_11166 [Paracoccidioides brasiliensis Pb18]|uniref:Uncharacterized protein n=1 Tax=Paracoccidioides brasiliensis (strain Pb18) TaxID=502780 RepID=A0A0A0HU71_PARBD|nr:uncharacterized protein PADG_11166 [Paracoccidioides brasiliensis Pb18]KGM92709.1 hypothetical protein PADG_11166 [Paracoccidioides brasiliensis Pb18]
MGRILGTGSLVTPSYDATNISEQQVKPPQLGRAGMTLDKNRLGGSAKILQDPARYGTDLEKSHFPRVVESVEPVEPVGVSGLLSGLIGL